MEEELTKLKQKKEYQKKWRQDNFVKRSIYGQEYYANNKEKYVDYYFKNLDHIKERSKQYYIRRKAEKLEEKIKNLIKN